MSGGKKFIFKMLTFLDIIYIQFLHYTMMHIYNISIFKIRQI